MSNNHRMFSRQTSHPMDLLSLLLQVTLVAVVAAPPSAPAKQDCKDICGNITIPYPFGTGPGCYHDNAFLITCNNTFNPPKPFLGVSNIGITGISVQGQLYIRQYIARDCYDQSGTRILHNIPSIWLSKFRISSTKNKFTAIGCATRASIVGKKDGKKYESGCMTICDSKDYVTNGSCSGIGCCQTSIPEGVAQYEVNLDSYFNHRNVWNFNNCSYAFVVEEDKFNFSSNFLSDFHNVTDLPVVLDWAVGDVTSCEDARKSSEYACKDNSNCYKVDFGPGYRCNCSEGYRGNPYVTNGCEDINECKELNPCESVCENTEGSYKCSCPKWYSGDGKRNGSGCIADQLLLIKLGLGIGIVILVLIVGCSSLYWVIRKRKRAKYFKQNGGETLQQKLEALDGSVEAVKIFTIEELKKATNNFNKKSIVGKGGFGEVYKGVLPQNKIVAIKKFLVVDQSKLEQFSIEVIAFSQINHPNVVKLLGCCLEVKVPLMVYEFISKGTLSQHIHEVDQTQHIHEVDQTAIPWEIRLKIAKETAIALSYLHYEASIIHRDVKSSNILLDDDFTAKLSDFGASRIGPLDKTNLPTMVEGTVGYLDPEYFRKSRLSNKSDVYSFGVVLAELLTDKTAVFSDGPENESHLSTYFISSMKENPQFLDDRIVKELGNAEQVHEVAKLALICLRLEGDKRPTMKKVASRLVELVTVEKHLWDCLEENPEETDHLLAKSLDCGSTSTAIGTKQ